MTDQNRNRIQIVLIDVDGNRIEPQFFTPLVNELHPNNECVKVDIHFENNQLIIQRNDASSIIFRRPTYCPFTNLHFQKISSQMIEEIPSGSIAVGVVILFESHDRRVLLTRRARHMRTFPSCWVCPGGGIESGETLLQAGVRELREEAGIEVSADELETSRTVALWESSFPIELAHGMPRRHHLVIYLHVRSTRTVDTISVAVDPTEVDAYTWLTHEQIAEIGRLTMPSSDGITFSAHIHPTGLCDLPFHLLATADYNQPENLTNGTRFALERLYILDS